MSFACQSLRDVNEARKQSASKSALDDGLLLSVYLYTCKLDRGMRAAYATGALSCHF
jgi:hypothetical protein